MLRSFAYAAASGPRATGDQDAELAWLDRWADAMAATFLGRLPRTRSADCPSLPADPADAERLLQLFLLEKALYEVRYELANRPDWLGIPSAGVLALLDRPKAARQQACAAATRCRSAPQVQDDGQTRFSALGAAAGAVSLVLVDAGREPADASAARTAGTPC